MEITPLTQHDYLKMNKDKKTPNRAFFYSCDIALTGHIAAHVPHDIHLLGSITHLPSGPTDIAPTGHAPMHV